MKKILFSFGTRPEAIKMAPVIRKFKDRSSKFKTIVCVTAQHRQMLDQILNAFKIVPDHDMNIMTDNQDLFDITLKALGGLKKIICQEKPDLILVQGDTTTTFVTSLAAYYYQIPIGHIEAGLRTYNKYHPFPEEKNRHMTTVLADFHFVPTKWAKTNLLKERIPKDKIWITGNTVVDALFMITESHKTSTKRKCLEQYFKDRYGLTLADDNRQIILVTSHRRENFGEGIKTICFALKEISEKRKDVVVVYPVHLNPNIQQPVNAILKDSANIHLIEPLDYESFIFLMSKSHLVLTDSGGIQEEAPSLGIPVLVMRNTTERPEGIEAGVVKLVGTEKYAIVNNTLALLSDPSLYNKMSQASNPYGDGKASERIVKIVENTL